MTLTKPALRSSLGDDHFKQAAWVSALHCTEPSFFASLIVAFMSYPQVAFNSPGFHEIDVMAFVKRWKADGHLSAAMKDTRPAR